MSTAAHSFDAAPREDMRQGLVWAVGLHVGILVVIAVWGLLGGDIWTPGDPTGNTGTAVAITPVASVPIVRDRARVRNPVANPVEHDVPALPEPPKPAELVPPDAPDIEIPKEREIPKPKAKTQPTKRAKQQKSAPKPTQNQIGSSTGARADAEVLDAGRDDSVGFGTSGRSAFGMGYQWYADAMQRKVAQQWRGMMGQIRGSSRQPAVITFRISRTGALDQIKLAQSSGNRSLDFTAMRAVQRASPLQRLPRQIPKNSLTVELWFQLDK